MTSPRGSRRQNLLASKRALDVDVYIRETHNEEAMREQDRRFMAHVIALIRTYGADYGRA